MSADQTSSGQNDAAAMPLNETHRKHLLKLHKALLHLHKALLDEERGLYEKANGPVATSGQVLNLVMYDPWFDWLHRISEQIVQIDELTDGKKAATSEQASELLANLRTLFRATDVDTPFMERYKAILQRQPAAVLAHIEVQRLLAPDA